MSAQAPDQFNFTATLVAAALQLSIVLSHLAFGLAYIDVSSDIAAELGIRRVQVPVGTWHLGLAFALAVPAFATLRTVRLWAWRSSLVVVAATALTAALERRWPVLILALLAVWLLLARPLRTAAHRSPEDRELSELEDRGIRLAKRRLADEAPNLRDIHLAPRTTTEPDG